MSQDNERLADGRTIADVLREDAALAARREREEAEREDATFETYMEQAFGLGRPPSVGPSTASTGPNLHAGPRASAEPDDDAVIDAYVEALGGAGS